MTYVGITTVLVTRALFPHILRSIYTLVCKNFTYSREFLQSSHLAKRIADKNVSISIHAPTVTYICRCALLEVYPITRGLVILQAVCGLTYVRTLGKSYYTTFTPPDFTIERTLHKSTSELGTPLYTGQPAGCQWCPL